MNFFDNIIYYCILLYIIILPIFPSKFKIKSIPLNGDILLAAIIFIYIIQLFINKNSRDNFYRGIKNLFRDLVGLFGVILFAVMLISVSYASSKGTALNESIRFATFVALYFIIKFELKGEKVKNTLVFFMGISLVISILGLIGMNLGLGIESQATNTYGAMIRIESTLENSNNLAAFLILSIFPFLNFALSERKKKRKLLLLICSLIIFTCLILTQSRNAYIALAIGFLLFAIITNWKSIFLFILAFIAMMFIPQFRDRIMQISDVNQNISRIKLWEIAIKMIKDHPLLGIGNGNYATLYDKYQALASDLYYNAHGQFHPHNIFLKIQSELGIAGSVSFIAFLVGILWKVIRIQINVKDKFYKCFYKGFLVSFMAFITMNLIDNFFSAPKVIAFVWIILALAEVISEEDKELL